MKCIKCGVDNKYKDRIVTNGRCSNCKHPIVFDPRKDSLNITDPFFMNFCQFLSVNQSLYFTEKQFFYSFNKKLEKRFALKPGALAVILIVLGFVMFFISMASGSIQIFMGLFLLFIAIALLSIFYMLSKSNKWRKRFGMSALVRDAKMEESKVREIVSRWTSVNGWINGLLPPITPLTTQTNVSSEVANYSFDRLVVCENASVAQMLLANNFHFENNCAVLAIDKYPQNIFPLIMQMLRRNPDLKVYALHDASPTGCALVEKIRTDPEWFGGQNVAIYDLGLLPRQVFEKGGFVRRSAVKATEAATIPNIIRLSLQPDEIKWLEEGNYVEIESLPPQMLLRVLSMGIAKSRTQPDALIPLTDSPTSPVLIYTYDTFG